MPASQPLDEDHLRVDRSDLFCELGLAVRRDLSPEHHKVDLVGVEPAGDVAEVVGGAGLVAEVAQPCDGVVEDELALAD